MMIDRSEANVHLDYFGLQQAPFDVAPRRDPRCIGANRDLTFGAILFPYSHTLGRDGGIIKLFVIFSGSEPSATRFRLPPCTAAVC